MCGICGWVSWRGGAEAGAVRRMVERLHHRGPDGEGWWQDPEGTAVLGHRRLAVLDPTPRADQPMVDPSGKVLVYNGEVYSFPALRRDLEREGRRLGSSGDTEVVLGALAQWGASALERFSGMFALALWDPGERRLLLARDRLGIKPLFWARAAGGLVFASELGALLAHPDISRRLDPDEVARWLQLGYSAGEATLLEGVHRLPPGCLLEVDERGLQVRRWYDLVERVTAGEEALSEPGPAAEELEARLRAAVRERLVSDVPLGCFLSGGVDSTAVVAAAAAEGARPGTMTVTFAGGADEGPAAAATAAALGLEHDIEPCAADEMLEAWERWPTIASDPLADPSLAPTWVVSRAARRRWTVALSGDGGDELLSGYPRLRLMPRLEPLLRLGPAVRSALLPPLPARRWAAKLRAAVRAGGRWEAYQALQGVWPAREVTRLLGRDEAPPPWPAEHLGRLDGLSPWQRYRLLDATTFLPERVLAKVDRASMSCSLEVRVPLLDHRVAELLLSLPASLSRGKGLLREVIGRLGGPNPPRRKRGFEAPLAQWLRGPLRDQVSATLDGETVGDLGLDRQALRRSWEAHQSGRVDHAERLFAVAVLARWVERFVR